MLSGGNRLASAENIKPVGVGGVVYKAHKPHKKRKLSEKDRYSDKNARATGVTLAMLQGGCHRPPLPRLRREIAVKLIHE
jgi:hypothetical protein